MDKTTILFGLPKSKPHQAVLWNLSLIIF